MSTRSLRGGCRAALALTALVSCTLCHAAPFVYVANAGSDSISVIDVATNTVVRTFAVGVFPTSVALNPTSNRGYVANNVDDTVSVFDSASVYATVPVATAPNAVAVDAAGRRVYVSNDFSTLTVMDAIASTVVASVPVGTCASGLAVHPSGSVAYVATCTPQQIYVVDAFSDTVTSTIPLPFEPADIAVNPAGTRIYASSPSTAAFTVIETGTNVTTSFPLPDTAAGLAVNPSGTRLYAALDAINAVAVVDTGTNTVIAMIPVGSTPVKIAIDATGTRAYVANATGDTISVVNLGNNTVEATIPVGSLPLWVAISAGPPPLVTSYTAQSATGSGLITVQLSGGGPTCSLLEPRFIPPPPGSPPVPPTRPGNINFPHGLFDFRTQGCAARSTITLSITYPAPIGGAEYWKYGPTPDNTAPHWYTLPAQINANVATTSITDGGLGDDDLVPNGVIVDQGGPGIGVAPIPALSQWMLALLGLAMLGIGALHRGKLRRI